jgi:hypothetical protein
MEPGTAFFPPILRPVKAGYRLPTVGIALALMLSACGGGDDEAANPSGDGQQGTTGAAATDAENTEEAIEGPAGEASPEAAAQGPAETGELSDEDAAAVTAIVRGYIEALERRDAEAVCALFEPGALPIQELPHRRGNCARSLAASIGYARPGGTPVWKRTTIEELNEVSVSDDRARVTATVTHQFADRKYPSVEDDVIYLDRVGDRWLLAKPSGTLYRAVGYPEPPLRALTPP